jgi:hypothetical protein
MLMAGRLPSRLAGSYTNAGQVNDGPVHPGDQGQVDSAHHGRHPVGRHPSANNNTIRLLLLLSSSSCPPPPLILASLSPDESRTRRAGQIRNSPSLLLLAIGLYWNSALPSHRNPCPLEPVAKKYQQQKSKSYSMKFRRTPFFLACWAYV